MSGTDTKPVGLMSGGPMGWISLPLRLALGGLFLYAAVNKLTGYESLRFFSKSVEAFQLGPVIGLEKLPDWAVLFATVATPWVEVLAGALLIGGLFTRAAAAAIGLLLVMFTAMIIRALALGMEVKCGCFGEGWSFCGDTISPCNLVQNGAMLAIAALITLTPRHPLSLDSSPLNSNRND